MGNEWERIRKDNSAKFELQQGNNFALVVSAMHFQDV